MRPDHPYDASPHSLLQGARSPGVFLTRFLRVRPEEVRILLWITAIQISMSISSVLINNLSQATFLKRFGVQYLPLVFLIEAVVTFLLANSVGIMMSRFRTLRVFTGLLILFAISGIIFRLLIPLGHDLIYPALYVFKSMAIGVLPILYWDMVSDLFTTQQGKRLYTLIIAGGILGTTAGSLMTGRISLWIGVDNVLWIYAAGMVLAALLNENTERVIGGPVDPRVGRKPKEKRPPFLRELQEFMDYARHSVLLKTMILLVAIPNMVLPILTYQFNVSVDAFFATEQGAINFFGLFRGISNAVIFGALMVSSRLVTRWGIPTTLLVHPINYLISFVALFIRFDIIMAAYARFSTELFKSTLNNPARAILYNFFPKRMRGLVRVILRGNVVRGADFAGSALLLIASGLLEPRSLSLVAAPLVIIWLFTNIRIKKAYSTILVQSLTERQIDWKGMEDMDFQAWFRDPKSQKSIFQGLHSPNPDVVLVSGQILGRARPRGWTEAIIDTIETKPPRVQGPLLDLLSKKEAPRVRHILERLKEFAPPETLALLIRALARMDPSGFFHDLQEWASHPDPTVKEEAIVGLHAAGDKHGLEAYSRHVSNLLRGEDNERHLAIRILARTGDPHFEGLLLDTARDPDPERRSLALEGLGRMQHTQSLELAGQAVEDPDPRVRLAGLSVFRERMDEVSMEVIVRLLDDDDSGVRKNAVDAVRRHGPTAIPPLLSALTAPSRDLREQALTLLEEQGLPRAEISRFALDTLRDAYTQAAFIHALARGDAGPAMKHLIIHLSQRIRNLAETVLRVLAAVDFGDRRGVILKAIRSKNQRDVDDALEALENSIHPDIRLLVFPLLRGAPFEDLIPFARRKFTGFDALEDTSTQDVLSELTESKDPSTRVLALAAFRESGYGDEHPPMECDLIQRLELLQLVPLFRELSVDDLVALSRALQPVHLSSGMAVIREGDPGNALYLIREGEISVIKHAGKKQEHLLARLGRGEFIGEMSLIDHAPRSASVRAESEADLFSLEGARFTRLMERRPTLPLTVCRVLVQRINELESRLIGKQRRSAFEPP